MKRPLLLLSAAASIVLAQDSFTLRDNHDEELSCSRARFCEMREDKAAASGQFAVEGIHNGSVTVYGWSRNDVRIRWRVSTNSSNQKDAQDLFKRIHTRVSGSRASVDGPDYSFAGWLDSDAWEASVEIFAPYKTALRLEAHNGAITASDIAAQVDARSHNGTVRLERIQGNVDASSHNGAIRLSGVSGATVFEAHNGQVNLTGLQGDVRGVSHNGAVIIELAGKPAAARNINLENNNGGITLGLPSSFSARVHTETDRGGVASDFPTTGRSSGGGMHRIDNNFRDFEIGAGGGASIRIRTNNGEVRLKRL